MNKPSPHRRERRSRFPEVNQITGLIDETRALRLTLVTLTNDPRLNELAKEAVTELQNVSAKLERLAELVTNAKSRPRRRTRIAQTEVATPSEDRIL